MKRFNQTGHLRVATPKDANTLAAWWADCAVMEHAGFPDGLKTDIVALEKRLMNPTEKDTLWIIEDDARRPIGEMHHAVKHRTATIGIKICDARNQGQGLGKIALKRLISHIFETTDVERIWLDTMMENTRAQRFYASLHFTKTRIRKDVWTDQRGRARTSVEYELERQTYEEHQRFFEDRV